MLIDPSKFMLIVASLAAGQAEVPEAEVKRCLSSCKQLCARMERACVSACRKSGDCSEETCSTKRGQCDASCETVICDPGIET